MTALHWAALGGHLDAVDVFLRSDDGRELFDIVDKKDRSPLHLAAYKGHAEVCARLIAAGPAGLVLEVDREEHTALHVAVTRRHLDAVAALTATAEGRTALHAEDADGVTALAFARELHALVPTEVTHADVERMIETLEHAATVAAEDGPTRFSGSVADDQTLPGRWSWTWGSRSSTCAGRHSESG